MPKLEDYVPALKYGGDISINVDIAEIKDANGTTLIELDTVDSAETWLRFSNNTTGNAPTISAIGNDTNIIVQLTPKGTSEVAIGTRATADDSGGSATINANRGRYSLELTTGADGTTNIDLKNTRITPDSDIVATLSRDASLVGNPMIANITAGDGSATIQIYNAHTGDTCSGSAHINFIVLSS